MTIRDCGEIAPGEEWNICDNDKSDDKLPPFPEDWNEGHHEMTVISIFLFGANQLICANAFCCYFSRYFQLDQAIEVLESIKSAGNLFFSMKEYVDARRKYKKTVRYFNFFKDRLESKYRADENVPDAKEKLQPVIQINSAVCLNIAAVELKLNNADSAKNACDEVLLNDPANAKALYRRGQAHISLKNYDDALIDLELAYRLLPNDKNIQNELHKAKEIWRNYQNQQMNVYKNLFERI